ncbi:class I ribonucleotide reductase maintenance protein YfaE [Pseudoalteromonas xiamenensis]|uniref:2Fe-2S ferredoxin-like protein n=1 Tax=Pseudoalteromonas xiamenensis TaxID=882626 RepID=A0A975DGQ6_9GAMM|nr:class I ribonucleotide reductase maintenance protein YfaE [Pseudoalteromonas xiamenensis]QTH71551.1 2Fe-2S ferredoxin-like protein [Pseudoalteromonas xiamenensis]
MVEKSIPVVTLTNHNEPLQHAAHSPSLLVTLESAKIDAPYQCREGFCGACRVKLIKGQVIYNEEPLAFVREGEVLTCCSQPITDIEIELF